MTGAHGRRSGGAGIAAAVALLLVLGLAALAVAARHSLAESAILWALRGRGLEPAAVRVESLTPGALVLGDLAIGDGDLSLRRLEARFSLGALLAGRLDALRVEGLRVRGRLGDGGLELGALDALRGEATGAGGSRPAHFPALPAARIEVEEALLVLETPAGPATGTLAIQLDEAGDGRLALAFTGLTATDGGPAIRLEPFAVGGEVHFRPDGFALTLEPAPFALAFGGADGVGRVRGETPRLALSGEPGGGALVRIEAQGGFVRLPDEALEAQGLTVDASVEAGSGLPSGTLEIAALRDLRKTPRFPRLAFDGRFAPEGDGLAFQGALTGLGGRITGRVSGAHSLATGSGRATWHAEPLRLAEDGIRPKEILPELAPRLQKVEGTIEARGEVAWGGGRLEGSADFGLRDLSVATPAAVLDRLNAAVRVDGPWPPRIPPGQLVSMARIDFGLELTNGLVVYAMRPGGVVELTSAEWHFAGGTIRTSGTLDLFAKQQRLLFEVADVDLEKLLAIVNLGGLSGSGRLAGRLPLVLSPASIEIDDAVLEAEAGGWIHYEPEGKATALAQAAAGALDDLLAALRNFRFERLSLRVDGATDDAVVVKVSLAGLNPEHRDAQPYELNLNVEGRLGDLLRQGAAAYQIPDRIQKKLDAIAQGRR